MPIPSTPVIENNVIGFPRASQLALIEHWARDVPENGIIVEVGSFAGRSAWHWAKSVHHSVTVYAVDSWDDTLYNKHKTKQSQDTMVGTSMPKTALSCSIEDFKFNTSDCPNIIPVKARSPNLPVDILEKLTQVDLVFLDESHQNPEFQINLNFWKDRIKPKGILCGDDFQVRDVHTVVCQYAVQNQKQLYARSNMWRLYDWDQRMNLDN
jgi:predicted O-methyltransferase YrrM